MFHFLDFEIFTINLVGSINKFTIYMNYGFQEKNLSCMIGNFVQLYKSLFECFVSPNKG